jgi:hypothetical protein
MAVWMAYSISVTSGVASRRLMTLPGMLERARQIGGLLWDATLFWFIPDSWIASPPYPALLNTLMILGFTFLLIVWLVWVLRKLASDDHIRKSYSQLVIILAIFCLVYLAMIVVTYLTIFPPITVNIRMLSPLHLAVLWLAVLLAAPPPRLTPTRRPLGIFFLTAACFTLLWYGFRTLRIVRQNYHEGMGYQSVTWKESDTLQQVDELPSDTIIVTNEELLILLLLDRPSYPLAEIYLDQPLETFTMYGDGELVDDTAQQVFVEKGAALVLFDTLEDQLELIYRENTGERIRVLTDGLNRVFKGEDGAIYYYPEKR